MWCKFFQTAQGPHHSPCLFHQQSTYSPCSLPLAPTHDSLTLSIPSTASLLSLHSAAWSRFTICLLFLPSAAWPTSRSSQAGPLLSFHHDEPPPTSCHRRLCRQFLYRHLHHPHSLSHQEVYLGDISLLRFLTETTRLLRA